MGSDTLCSCTDLTKAYGKKWVLRGCTLRLHVGELVGLVGENGSGKSTLVRCLLGFTRPSSGQVRLDATFGYCPQDDLLNRRLTVDEHIRLVATITGRQADRGRSDELVARLKLSPYIGTVIGKLSSGTYQKVKLLTSLLVSPQMLFLDEPYEGFDWQMYKAFWEIVAELRSVDRGVLVVTHLIYDLDRFDCVYEIADGIIKKTK